MGFRAWGPALLVLLAYPLASRYALDQGWGGARLATLLPVLAYCFLLAVFANSLRPGRHPVISRFARLEQGELSEELLAYTRRLTIIWCVFFAAMALLAGAITAWAPVAVWFWHTFLVSYLLIAALFLGEIVYRHRRFPGYRHAGPWRLLRNILKHGLR